MTAPTDDLLGFAPDDDAPIPYMARTREYYQAIGYTTPYRWAHYVEAPFQRLRKPLGQSRVALVTTAAPFDPAKGDQGPGAKYNGGAKFYRSMTAIPRSRMICGFRILPMIACTPQPTTAAPGFRCRRCKRLASQGRIGEVAPRFFGAPTNRSHRVTIETDAPEILRRCREDQVDAAVLVPNCPVCHQTISLVARHLEANGISTVVMGCAKDIVEHAAVPRFLFSDFPLGNSAGKPHDPGSQAFTLELALSVLEAAPGSQTTVQSPLRWSADASWKRDYNNVALLSADELARRRREFDAQKEIARGLRESAA